MGREYPNPLGTGMRFNFSSPLNIGRVTDKYMGVNDEDGNDNTRPHPTPLPCLTALQIYQKKIYNCCCMHLKSFPRENHLVSI